MITLFQSQENAARAIESGVEALKVFEKIGGANSLTTIANVSRGNQKEAKQNTKVNLIRQDTRASFRVVCTKRRTQVRECP